MKKINLLIFIAFLVIGSAYAEAEYEDSYGGTGGTDSSGQTIYISMGVYGDQESSYKAVFASEGFKARFPNVVIELQPSDFGGHHNRLVTQISAGSGANDIEAFENGYVSRFVTDGGFTDLSGNLYNGQAVGANLVRFAMANATTVEGQLLALPVDISPAVLYYRKSITDDAGVDLSDISSWDDYIEIGKKLTVDKDGDGIVDQYAITHASDFAITLLNGGKGDWFNHGAVYEPADRYMSVLNLVDAVQNAGISAGYTPWSGEWINCFKENKVVTMISASWLGGHFKNWMAPDLAGDWRIAYLPGKTYSSYGGTYLGIPEQTDQSKKAKCFEIIQYLCTEPDAQLITMKTTDAFPALTTIYDDPIMDEPVEYYGGQKVRRIFVDIALNIPVQYPTKNDAVAMDIFNQAINAVISGTNSPDEAYEWAKKEVNAHF